MYCVHAHVKGFSNHSVDGENNVNTKTFSPFCDRKHRFWIFPNCSQWAIAFLVWYDLQDGRFFLFS